MKCSGCGLEEDRDVIAVKNLLRRCQMDVGFAEGYFRPH
ncbi:MAG: hypothetical protein DSO00_03870 [Archaeoglobi archaeon]|nr:MAG: hypothetical protein DSO00_03870 [Archaeoglobi archaeon]